MKSPIIGVDLSSRKIAAIVLSDDDEPPLAQTMSVPKKASRADELLILSEQAEAFFTLLSSRYVFVESPVVGRGGARPTILQAQVDGLVQSLAVKCGHRAVYPVNNKAWKKAVVGNGNAAKGDTAAWLAAHHPVLGDLCGDDQDLVDAAGVALYGAGIISRAATRRT
jgi:Holliday junction resolvasome RuvABC endonuclease subunit